jgi:hypothetical protein
MASNATQTNPFAPYTTCYLQNLLVTNPGVNSFALGINGDAIANSDASYPFQDVDRQQILNELQAREAVINRSGTYQNTIVDNAATIGSVAPQVAIPNSIAVPPAVGVGSGPNPVLTIGQVR